jgi:hypothetical protein
MDDLNKANLLELNSTFILNTLGDVKMMMNDYQGVLKDLNEVDVLDPNNPIINYEELQNVN